MSPECPSGDFTEDRVLGGMLRLKQPRRGHRVGHDAILLAAACHAHAGERVIDLGAGVGAAGLAVAARVAGSRVTMVEVDADLAALAVENAKTNGLVERVNVVVLDIEAPASAYSAAGLGPQSADRVLMNPPFNDPARQRTSPDPQRRLAHAGKAGTPAAWIKTAARLLLARGTLTMIWRADGLAEVLGSLGPAFGAALVLPVHSKPGEAAIRVLVQATKGSRAPLALLPGFVLNENGGVPTMHAQSVLRDGAPLPLG